jgi:AcrR family transcriptional regulator
MKTITKKEKFFDETLKLIHEKGFRATTMRDIAQNMNFEVSNIYNYINSKEALLDYYIFDVLDHFTEYLENIINSSYSPLEKLKIVMSKHVHYTAAEPYKVSLFIYEWRDLNEPKLTEFKEVRSGYMAKVTELIDKAIKLGQLRPMDSEFATLMIFSSMRGLFNLSAENENINPIEIEKQLNDFIFLGIENKNPSK